MSLDANSDAHQTSDCFWGALDCASASPAGDVTPSGLNQAFSRAPACRTNLSSAAANFSSGHETLLLATLARFIGARRLSNATCVARGALAIFAGLKQWVSWITFARDSSGLQGTPPIGFGKLGQRAIPDSISTLAVMVIPETFILYIVLTRLFVVVRRMINIELVSAKMPLPDERGAKQRSAKHAGRSIHQEACVTPIKPFMHFRQVHT